MNSLGWLFAFSLIASPGSIVTFDNQSEGKAPSGWTVTMTNQGAAPRWEVVRDVSARTQPYVLAQTSTDHRQDRFPLAIFQGSSLRDGDVSVRLKPVAGRAEQGGGLVFRYRDERNYYMVRASALQDDVALYKVENGRCQPILPHGMPPTVFAVKHDIRPNNWNILKVSVRGNRFQVYVNHRRILEASDSTFAQAGKVGLLTAGDSVTYFDDFRINPK
jgi:3-keto-disaccharide hydrolase